MKFHVLKLKINHSKKLQIFKEKQNQAQYSYISDVSKYRDDFKNIYLNQKNHSWQFYKETRRKMNILMNGEDPVGGKWSFDEDNRKKLLRVPKFPLFQK